MRQNTNLATLPLWILRPLHTRSRIHHAMDTKNDAAMRGTLLSLLYRERFHDWAEVRPESFEPPWTMQEVFYFGREFHAVSPQLILDFPSENGRGGYVMRSSEHGKSVWEGRECTSLDIEGLPE